MAHTDMTVEKQIRRMARELLKRHPLRRGPYMLSDGWLRQVAYPKRKPYNWH